MNFNFSSFLTNSMRILNIVNRTLPLIREVNPAVNYVKTKLKSVNNNSLMTLPNNQNSKLDNAIKPELKKVITNNNSLTFFK